MSSSSQLISDHWHNNQFEFGASRIIVIMIGLVIVPAAFIDNPAFAGNLWPNTSAIVCVAPLYYGSIHEVF